MGLGPRGEFISIKRAMALVLRLKIIWLEERGLSVEKCIRTYVGSFQHDSFSHSEGTNAKDTRME